MNNVHTSPYGEAIRPRLNVADRKHNRAGVYHTRLRFSAEVAAPIVKAIDDACAVSLDWARRAAKSDQLASRIKRAAAPYVASDDGSTVDIKFRMKAIVLARSGAPRKQSPAIFAANGEANQKLEKAHGDTIRVSYAITPYSTGVVGAGVTLDIQCVQVLKQANAWVRTAEDFGFANEDAAASVAAST